MFNSLRGIRSAVQEYLDTKVDVQVAITPNGQEIDPGESFTAEISATNANANNGGIRLQDIIWHVQIQDASVALLVVPDAPMEARSGLDRSLPTLTPGDQVAEMYLFPARRANKVLRVGETQQITLDAQAVATASDDCFFYAKVYGTVSEDWLLPADQPTDIGAAGIVVNG